MPIEKNDSLCVSFVVPSFNAGDVISCALESLIAQTSGDWEAIVVDDGSTDDTAAVADRFAASDDRFHVIRQKNAGVSCARNTAVNVARGQYIAFLDADDSVELDFVEKLARLAAGDAPDVLALCYRAMPRGNTFGYGFFDGHSDDFLIRALSDKYATFPCWLFAVSRQLIVRNGIEFVAGRRVGEDQEFILKALCVAETCRSVDESSVFYNYQTVSETSAMAHNLEGQFEFPAAMLEVLKYFDGCKERFVSDKARRVEDLLIDRFVWACRYATEMALANGAMDNDVLAWLGEAMEQAGGGTEFNCAQLRSENQMFLQIWMKAPRFLPCYMRARSGVYSIGRAIKSFLAGRR